MSWRCSGANNDQLVDNLVTNQIVKSSKIAGVMKAVDRKLYTRGSHSSYIDAPQSIGKMKRETLFNEFQVFFKLCRVSEEVRQYKVIFLVKENRAFWLMLKY